MPSGWRDSYSTFPRSGSTPQDVDTNIVIFEVIGHRLSPSAIVAALKQEGLLINAIGGNSFRAVTHLDISSAMIEEACDDLYPCVGRLASDPALPSPGHRPWQENRVSSQRA